MTDDDRRDRHLVHRYGGATRRGRCGWKQKPVDSYETPMQREQSAGLDGAGKGGGAKTSMVKRLLGV